MSGFRFLALGLLGSLVVAPSSVTAQVAEAPAVVEALAVVEVWLEAQQAYEQIPAFSAAVVHDQELVWSRAAGVAHPQSGEAATENTLYSICSISKLFTAVSVMQLRDRGLLTLRDPVSEHLPGYEVEQQHDGSPPVTVEGILTHSSGLPSESAHPSWDGPDFQFPTREQVIDGLRTQETLYPAWRYFQYSNLGFTLAGAMVEQLSGLTYDEYVQQYILRPLGMTDTYTEIPSEHRGGRFATGYGLLTREGRREEVEFFQTQGIQPAAGFASTAGDLAKFASWQFRLVGNHEEVLHAHTLDEMQRVHYVDPEFEIFWGLGFGIWRHGDKTLVGHGGSCPGFRSMIDLQMDEKIAVIFLANAMVTPWKFTRGIYDLVSPAVRQANEADRADEPERDVAVEDDGLAPDLNDFVGTYSGQPWSAESAVVRWKGSLAVLPLPTDNPAESFIKLKHDEGDVFYRVRADDERGEDYIFRRDENGVVVSFSAHRLLSTKVR